MQGTVYIFIYYLPVYFSPYTLLPSVFTTIFQIVRSISVRSSMNILGVDCPCLYLQFSGSQLACLKMSIPAQVTTVELPSMNFPHRKLINYVSTGSSVYLYTFVVQICILNHVLSKCDHYFTIKHLIVKIKI